MCFQKGIGYKCYNINNKNLFFDWESIKNSHASTKQLSADDVRY